MNNMGKLTTNHVNKAMNESVSEATQKATMEEVRISYKAEDNLKYIMNDTYNGGPEPLLGKIFYEKRNSNKLHAWPLSIPVKVNPGSILKDPITRMELMIEKKVAANVEFLYYLSLNLSADEIYEIKVVDNAAARLIDSGQDWANALHEWTTSPFNQNLINKPDVVSIGIVTGVVQKFVISKKYKKFDVSAKGGYVGVNVGGELYTSTSQYSFDVRYGLDLAYLPVGLSVEDFSRFIDTDDRIENKSEIMKLDSKLRNSNEVLMFESFIK